MPPPVADVTVWKYSRVPVTSSVPFVAAFTDGDKDAEDADDDINIMVAALLIQADREVEPDDDDEDSDLCGWCQCCWP
jgi:hypothetical protein